MEKIDLYEASDYAGLVVENIKFYYGYEETTEGRYDGETGAEWAFVAKVDGKEVARIGKTEIEHSLERPDKLEDSCAKYLLAGIGIYLKSITH